MTESPRATWKFWKRNMSTSARHVKLGIDYGVSNSKIVFRDCNPSSSDSSEIVLHDGSLRIPSRVCLTATSFLFGHATIPASACDSFESLKTRVAFDVTANPAYQLNTATKLPSGFCAADLAALTVWFLISTGHRAVTARFNKQMANIELSMTMGVPADFLANRDLKATFLGIARRAWLFYRNEGVLDCEVSIDRARQVLHTYPLPASTLSEEEAREWIRSEGDAALWMVLHSPSVNIGPHACLVIGAGSTHTTLFRIFGKLHTIKRSLAPFGTGTVPVGMDAVDRAIAEYAGRAGDDLPLRGAEFPLQTDAKFRDAALSVCNQIYDSYREAWNEAYTKIGSNPLELLAWTQHKVVILGGGSLVPFLADAIRVHPGKGELLPLVTLEQPTDLAIPGRKNLASEELNLAAVAYGLSHKEFHVPNPYCRDSV